MSIETYSPTEVAAMFGTKSDRWLRRGVQSGRFPHLRVCRQIRFTDEHVAFITALLEQAPKEAAPVQAAPDTSVFGATSRSSARHRHAS